MSVCGIQWLRDSPRPLCFEAGGDAVCAMSVAASRAASPDARASTSPLRKLVKHTCNRERSDGISLPSHHGAILPLRRGHERKSSYYRDMTTQYPAIGSKWKERDARV